MEINYHLFFVVTFTVFPEYPVKYLDYFRMSVKTFDELLERIRESILKKNYCSQNAYQCTRKVISYFEVST